MPFSQADLSTLEAIVRQAAQTEIMPRFRKLRPQDIRTKSSPQDLVTEADVAAEDAMTAACRRAFPGILVVGEEAAASDRTLIGQLAGAPFAVTLDPVDGTANFAAGLPLFGVMAAVTEHGETVAAIILDPVTGSASTALKGQGAWEHAADGSRARLRVACGASVADMTGMVGWRFMAPALRAHVMQNLLRVAQTWDHRCAAHEYRQMCAGHSDFVLFNRLMPWDHLPGVLLHQEAGGYNAKFDASPYRPGETTGGLICAPDRDGWRELRRVLVGEAA